MRKLLKKSEWFSFKDYRHLPVFIGFIVLLLGLTVALTLATNSTQGGQSGASYQKCIPLPSCYRENRCPEIINYRLPNMRWCLPSPTPTASGCYYQPVACPLYCIQGKPCPTCAPKLVCPSPNPTQPVRVPAQTP